MVAQFLILVAVIAYVGIRFRIGVLKVRARREGDVEREAKLAALGYQMMMGLLMAGLVYTIVVLLA